MKKFVVLLVLIIILAGVCSVYFFTLLVPPFSERAIKEETNNYSIKATYPHLDQTEIDKDIESFIQKNIKEIKSAAPPSPKIPFKYKNTLLITYEKHFVSRNYVSLAFMALVYTGGAHPITIVTTKNYDRQTGKILKLEDLGIADSALARIRPLVISLLMKIDRPDKKWIEEGVNARSLQNFALDHDGLTFYFSPYDVAPYSYGIQKVKIPIKSLAKKDQ